MLFKSKLYNQKYRTLIRVQTGYMYKYELYILYIFEIIKQKHDEKVII